MRIEWNKKYTTISVYAVIVFSICFLIYKLTNSWADTKEFFNGIQNLLSPFLIAILIAYLINPLVNLVEKRIFERIKIKGWKLKNGKVRRTMSVLSSYVIIISIVVLLLGIIIPELVNNIASLGEIDINAKVDHVVKSLEKMTIKSGTETYSLDLEAVEDYISNSILQIGEIPKAITNFLPGIVDFTAKFAFGLLDVLIAIILSIYMLVGKEGAQSQIRKAVIAFFPEKFAYSLFDIASTAHSVFSKFFVGKILDSTIVATLCFILCLILKVPFALLVSILLGVTNIIPTFGPFIGGGLSFIFLLTVDPVKAFTFLIMVVVLQQVDANLLEPRIIGESIGLSPGWVIFSIILFGSLFGFIGLLFGAPFVSVMKGIIDQYIERRYKEKLPESKAAPTKKA